ncbi:hypothetical protein [Leptospira ognonensis]|nr:hypothetical protein [Leptospira ognonensis]
MELTSYTLDSTLFANLVEMSYVLTVLLVVVTPPNITLSFLS